MLFGPRLQRLQQCNRCTRIHADTDSPLQVQNRRLRQRSPASALPHSCPGREQGGRLDQDLKVLAGEVPKACLTEALDWAGRNRPLLLTAWKELNS